jgi:hypothetical protein
MGHICVHPQGDVLISFKIHHKYPNASPIYSKMTPTKNTSAKGKSIYPNLRRPTKIKCLLRKVILLLIGYT